MFKHWKTVIATGIIAVIAAGNIQPAYAARSGMVVQGMPEKADEGEAVNVFHIESKDKLVAESEILELYLDESAFIMKIRDKRSGYIWSTAVPADQMQGMSTEWIRMCQSFLTMDFAKENGTVQRCPLKHGSAKSPKITEKENGFDAKVFFKEAKASLVVQVRLEGDEVKVKIPDESIEIDKDYKVNKIFVCPFLGASYQDSNPGYLFVPDGSGALMRFQKSRSYNTSYMHRIFGKDKAKSEVASSAKKKTASDTEQIYMPIFGSVHGVKQNGFAGIVTGGEQYCELQASPAGAIIDYFWESPVFLYNEIYWQKTGNSDGYGGVQKHQNKVNAEVTYHFLNGADADYVGIARAYQEKLVEENPELKKKSADGHIGMKIDALMADAKKGVVGEDLQVMTKLSDLEEWYVTLKNAGIENISLAITGYEKGGENATDKGKYSLDKNVGSNKELKSLEESLEGKLFLQTDITSGYIEQYDTEELRIGMDGDVVKQVEDKEMYTDRVYANEDTIHQEAESYLKESPVKSFSLEGLADHFYGDYNRKAETTRKDAANQNLKILKEFQKKAEHLSVAAPNLNMLSEVVPESVYNIPIGHSGYTYFNDSVPALQIVLSGYVDYYGEYQNFAANTEDEVLKMIDYGCWPSYLATEEEPVKLSGTNSSDIYTSEFDTWFPYMEETYHMVDEILSKVKGASIIGREVLQSGICVTSYDNGYDIYTNYTEQKVEINDITLESKSAQAWKRGE